jgi:hypothetical protein
MDGRIILQEVLGRTNHLIPRYDKGHIENDVSNNYSNVACVFVTSVTFLPSRCLATIGRYTYRHIILMGEIFLIRPLRWGGCRDIRTKVHKDWFRR